MGGIYKLRHRFVSSACGFVFPPFVSYFVVFGMFLNLSDLLYALPHLLQPERAHLKLSGSREVLRNSSIAALKLFSLFDADWREFQRKTVHRRLL